MSLSMKQLLFPSKARIPSLEDSWHVNFVLYFIPEIQNVELYFIPAVSYVELYFIPAVSWSTWNTVPSEPIENYENESAIFFLKK